MINKFYLGITSVYTIHVINANKMVTFLKAFFYTLTQCSKGFDFGEWEWVPGETLVGCMHFLISTKYNKCNTLKNKT